MIKAKALALCICPAVATPPAVLAVHPPARHAVAHLLHRAADRLDQRSAVRPVAPSPVAASLPCAPSLASSGGGLPVGGGIGGGDLPANVATESTPTDSVAGGSGTAVLGGGGGLVGGGAMSGGGGLAFVAAAGSVGASGGVAGMAASAAGAVPGPIAGPVAGLPSGSLGTPPLPAPVGEVSGAPEPAAWLLLVVGFGLVGGVARARPGRAGWPGRLRPGDRGEPMMAAKGR